MFIVLLDYVKPIEEVDALIEEHRLYLDSLYAAGSTLVASGPRVPRTGGFFIAATEDRAALMHLLEADPFYRAGIAEYHIHECVPTKSIDEFRSAIRVTKQPANSRAAYRVKR